MHPIFRKYIQSFRRTVDLRNDIHSLLVMNRCADTADHSIRVGEEARKLALMFGANPESAEIAGWLHDISALIPNQERIMVARHLDIDILPEEEAFPMIIHQKLSRYMARDIFDMTDPEILDAIGCHTTLRAQSTLLDQVLFVADKIAWDQPGKAPYLDDLLHNLDKSLEHAAFSYIRYLWERRHRLRVVHPWLIEAYEDLKTYHDIDH